MNTKASLLERFAINLYTPLDKIGKILPQKTLEKITKTFMISTNCVNETYDKKIRTYEVLINHLSDQNFSEKNKARMIKRYSITPCGKLELRVAKSKRYLSKKDYKKYIKN